MVARTAADPWYLRPRQWLIGVIEPAFQPRLVPALGWALTLAFAVLVGYTTMVPRVEESALESTVLAWDYEMGTDYGYSTSSQADAIAADSDWSGEEALGMDLIVLSDDIDALYQTIDQF